MGLPSILIASFDNAIEELTPLLDAVCGGKARSSDAEYANSAGRQQVDLIVLLCRDARKAGTRLPRSVGGVPVVALTANFSDDALKGLEAVFFNPDLGIATSLEGLLKPKLIRMADVGKQESTQVDLPGGLIDGQRLVGESPLVEETRSSIQRVASTDTNVLITGETGTGKELIAELIHKNGKRRENRFICINCAAIPDSLLESELFGFERGAFTGAQVAGEGKLGGAEGGTVFFDEIGDMSLCAQAKILRVIETREVQRLGAKRSTRLDFRIIAATNQDVDSAASASRFRRDLYFRLNVARVHSPPLRERKSDIPVLADHFIQHFNRQFGRHVEGLATEAMRYLLEYEWPGNVRELKNTLEALFVNLPTGKETRLELPELLRRRIALPSEQERLLEALWAADWNKSKAARQLCWSRMTLYRKMAKYGMERGSKNSLLNAPPDRA